MNGTFYVENLQLTGCCCKITFLVHRPYIQMNEIGNAFDLARRFEPVSFQFR